MRLRNKKTGEITEGTVWIETRLHTEPFDCPSIADLVEYWEDCKEPLIKDGRIRKAVRAWAELVPSAQVRYDHSDGRFYTHSDCVQPYSISFPIRLELDEVKNYTVAELCGEEEE